MADAQLGCSIVNCGIWERSRKSAGVMDRWHEFGLCRGW